MSTILLALLAGALSRAAPITDSATERIQPEPSYVPPPRGRGTLDLLFTCVITLVICIWTAIHPDILPKPTLGNRLKDKALYVIIGLFSPEIILAMAFNQWRKARMVLVAWRRCAALEHLEAEVEKAKKTLGIDQTNPTGEEKAGPTVLARPLSSNEDSNSAERTTPELPSPVAQRRDITSTVAQIVTQEGPELGRLEDSNSAERTTPELPSPVAQRRDITSTVAQIVTQEDPELGRPEDSNPAERTTPELPSSVAPRRDEITSTVAQIIIKKGPELDRLEKALSNARGAIDKVHQHKQGLARVPPGRARGNLGSNRPPEGSTGGLRHRLYRFRSGFIEPFIREKKAERQEAEFNAIMDAAIWAKCDLRRALYKYKPLTRNKSTGAKTGIRRVYERFTEGIKSFRSSDGEFDMGGAFFAVMGGYRFSPLSAYDHPEYERGISAETLVHLLKTGIITPKQLARLTPEVEDKGKSNMLAKLLVCGQASWMAINCLSRKSNGLPITIIELNVMVHVLIALSVYICWWKKPHDAGTAISLTLRTLDIKMCAAVYLLEEESKLNFYVTEPGKGALYIARSAMLSKSPDKKHRERERPFAEVAVIPEPPELLRTVSDRLGENSSTKALGPAIPEDPEEEGIYSPEQEREEITAQDGLPLVYEGPGPSGLQRVSLPQSAVEEWRHFKRITLRPGCILVEPRGGFGIQAPPTNHSPRNALQSSIAEDIVITEADLQIFRDAAFEMRSPKGSGIVSPASENQDKLYNYPIVLKRPHTAKKASRFRVGEMFWALVPLCLIYGGLHASLWNSYFPTPAERLLWRISSALVAIPGLGVGAIWGVKKAAKPGSMVRRPRRFAKALLSITSGSLFMAGAAVLLLIAIGIPLGVGGGIIYGAMLAHPRIWKLHISKPGRIAIYFYFYIAVAFVVCVCLLLAIGLLGSFLESDRIRKAMTSVRYLVATVCVIAYCSARAFIFIETFICLRSLPPGSYQTVPFEDFWPHI